MQRTARYLLLVLSLYLISSCELATPAKVFDVAILNCNMIHGFAGRELAAELTSPSVKLTNAATGDSAPMSRKEVIENKIVFVQNNLSRLKKLRQNKDNADVLSASLALHEFVLPVFQNEYAQLAALYDTGAPAAKIQALSQQISQKYGPKFESLFNQLTAVGKPFAARHDIKVKWDVQTAPSF